MPFDLIGQDIDAQLARAARGETRLWRAYWIRSTRSTYSRLVFIGEIFAPLQWVARDDACRVFGARTHNERRAIWVGESAPFNRPVWARPPDTPRIRQVDRTDRTTGALSPWQAAQAKALILRRLGEEITLRDICDELGLHSRPYLVRGFKAQTGVTPYQWQIDRLMDRAKALLRHTELPIGRISELVGYTDRTAFARVFKRETGGSARAWRAATATPDARLRA